jgi:large subunit ribosomal protein L24
MKNTNIAKSYKSSERARKQRKYRALAPIHSRHEMMSSNLSKDLRKKYNRRGFSLIKGDTVRIMRGQFSGQKGKVIIVNMQKLKVYIEGIQRSKRDGTKVNVPIDPSNVQITELKLDDKKRINSLNKKKSGGISA